MKKTRRILAASLALAMAVAVVPVNAVKAADPIEWDNDGGVSTVEGEGSVIQPIIEVSLPGDLAFQIDPLNLEIADTQILGGDYNIVNRGNVDVKVQVDPYVNKLEGSVLDIKTAAAKGGTIGGVDYSSKYADLTSSTDKKSVFLAAIAADKAGSALVDGNEDGIYEFSYLKGSDVIMGRKALTFDSAKDNAVKTDAASLGIAFGSAAIAGTTKVLTEQALTETTAISDSPAFTFNLKKSTADTNGDLAPQVDSVGSFTIVGAVDPKQTYADGEVAVYALYKMSLLTAQDASGFESIDATNKIATLVKPKS